MDPLVAIAVATAIFAAPLLATGRRGLALLGFLALAPAALLMLADAGGDAVLRGYAVAAAVLAAILAVGGILTRLAGLAWQERGPEPGPGRAPEPERGGAGRRALRPRALWIDALGTAATLGAILFVLFNLGA